MKITSMKQRAEIKAEIEEIQKLGRKIIEALGHDIKFVRDDNGTDQG